MQASVALFSAFAALNDLICLVELPLLNRDVDPHDVLPDNTASTDIQVADVRMRSFAMEAIFNIFFQDHTLLFSPNFRVSHEPFTKTNGCTVGSQGAIAVVLGDSVHVGGLTSVDGIALHALLWGNPPAIVHAMDNYC